MGKNVDAEFQGTSIEEAEEEEIRSRCRTRKQRMLPSSLKHRIALPGN